LRDAGQILELGEEVAMVQEKSVNRAVKDHHFYLLVGLERCHELPELQDEFWVH
jgi:hypothetical protein